MIEFHSEWGWAIATYLFFGGVSSGLYAVTFFMRRVFRVRTRVTAVLYSASLILLLAGVCCLVIDLGCLQHVFKGFLPFRNAGSWMAWGGNAVCMGLVLYFSSALIPNLVERRVIAPETADIRKAIVAIFHLIEILGLIVSIFICGYTGMLLFAADGVPFWNTPLLPVLFVLSSLSGGIAVFDLCVLVMALSSHLRKSNILNLTQAAVGIAGLESIVLLLLVALAANPIDQSSAASAAEMSSAYVLISGDIAWLFWIFVVCCGLVVPICFRILWIVLKRKRVLPAIVVSVLSLIGCFALRVSVLACAYHVDVIGTAILMS